MLFHVIGRCPISTDPTPEFLQASRDTLEQLGAMQRDGRVRGGGVLIGPLGVCFIAAASRRTSPRPCAPSGLRAGHSSRARGRTFAPTAAAAASAR